MGRRYVNDILGDDIKFRDVWSICLTILLVFTMIFLAIALVFTYRKLREIKKAQPPEIYPHLQTYCIFSTILLIIL